MVTDLPFTALSIPLVWANNGDSISREYAGTSALKGDFTRTGKRNVTGMMNDASNSLTRMYHNTIRDFWRQATVDFILGTVHVWSSLSIDAVLRSVHLVGYHKVEIFRHVTQSTLKSAEPGNDKRWVQVRANAGMERFSHTSISATIHMTTNPPL